MKTVVLAFDIERAGALDTQNTIAIGASVVDEDLKELDSFETLGYFEGKTQFDPRCWDQFWSKHKDTLEKLKYNGELNQYQREAEMVCGFLEFRLKWEEKAEKEGFKLELVADNNVYDGGFINQMIFEHTSMLPIPYSVKGEYSPFWETHSEQRGLLMAVYPEYKSDRGYSARVNRIYNIPESDKESDHTPANDAYNIAREQQVMLGIRDGKYTLNATALTTLKEEDRLAAEDRAKKDAEELAQKEISIDESGDVVDL